VLPWLTDHHGDNLLPLHNPAAFGLALLMLSAAA